MHLFLLYYQNHKMICFVLNLGSIMIFFFKYSFPGIVTRYFNISLLNLHTITGTECSRQSLKKGRDLPIAHRKCQAGSKLSFDPLLIPLCFSCLYLILNPIWNNLKIILGNTGDGVG